jgi:transcriptional regulator with XRE-family HTH domain
METVTETIRRLVEESGVSLAAISRHSKVSQSVLSRFLSGERGLSGRSVDKLAEYLDLVARPRRGRRGRRDGGAADPAG